MITGCRNSKAPGVERAVPGCDDGTERLWHFLNFRPEGMNRSMKQDRQCKCKVRLRCVLATIVAVEMQ